jgi:hypothetical protein
MPNLSINNNALGTQVTVGLGTLEQIKFNADGSVEIPELSQLPFRGIQVYDTPGTHTWTVPDGVTKAWVTVVGGGGEGGKGNAQGERGGGGGGGAWSQKLVDLTGTTSVPITVGAGAAGRSVNSGTDGLPGGTSSFGTVISCTGGGGGLGASNGGGTPGVATGGDINFGGSWGNDGIKSGTTDNARSAGTGQGGGQFGGRGSVNSATDATGPGGGGGGCPGGTTNTTGGGGNGLVLIQW